MTMKTAYFNRFTLEMPDECVSECSHSGACDDDVDYWSIRLLRPPEITPDKLAAELKEYGAWDADELADDSANWRRIIWIAAGQIQEEEFYSSEEN